MQPTKQRVEASAAGDKSPYTVSPVDRTEPVEEQEQVAHTHGAIGRMRLRDSDLTQRRTPSAPAFATGRVEVGVEVHQGAAVVLAARQMRQQFCQRQPSHAVLTCGCAGAERNGEREWTDTWQDRARNAAVPGVEALAAEDDLHIALLWTS